MYEMMAGQVSRNRLCFYCLQLNVLLRDNKGTKLNWARPSFVFLFFFYSRGRMYQ